MTSALFLCDGATCPPALKKRNWDATHSLNYRGPNASLNLRLQSLSHALPANVDWKASDLVRIAAYVYTADRMVSRGGLKDVYARHWPRHMSLVIPVGNPDFWSNSSTIELLSTLLRFLSDDTWEFTFCQVQPSVEQLVLEHVEARDLLQDPDSVVLFSGGADSLCAAVEAGALQRRRPVLVSHRSAPHISSRQHGLIRALSHNFPHWSFPAVSVWVHLVGQEAADTNQRTRSFLFASLGAAVAMTVGITDVFLADNGVVSINLPISGQLYGAMTTRTTHPKFIHLFNELLSQKMLSQVQIQNPFWNRTRLEVLNILKITDHPEMLQDTVSCAHTRGKSLAKPHCGVCSQCIDRRFASIAAGMEEYDIPERYELDIFTQVLAEGNDRTMAESYVRFAVENQGLSDDDWAQKFSQLLDCVVPGDPRPDLTAKALIDMLNRHIATVLEVARRQLGDHATDLLNGRLPPTCLVRLLASNRHIEDSRLRVIADLIKALGDGLRPMFQKNKPKNELDVQDKVHGIVNALQMKLGREFPLLPFAGITTKPDFAQYPDNGRGWLFVEMKYPASRRRVNGIVTEISSRTRVYRNQAAYVLFAVYDKGGYVANDDEFNGDLESEGVWVRVVR